MSIIKYNCKFNNDQDHDRLWYDVDLLKKEHSNL